MNPILESMLHYVDVYKYAAIFVFTFLGAVALPLPTGSMMIAAGFLVSLGHIALLPLLIVGILGNIVGDNTGYYLSRHIGMRLMRYPGFKKFKSSKLAVMETHVEKHPMLTIFWSRFFTAVAPSVNIVAGLARMRYWRYLLFESLGEIAEVCIFTFLGVWFGNEWETVSKYSSLFLIGLAISLYISARFWKSFSNKNIPTSAK